MLTFETIQKYQHRKPVQNKTPNTKPTVVSGQSISVKAMLHAQKSGIPIKTTQRVVESYFRNLDLTDISNMSRQYQEMAKTVKDAEQKQLEARQKAKEGFAKDFIKFKEFVKQSQEKRPENT